MTITRYDLGREYAGNTGSPAITEQADGAYVQYADHAAMIGEFQAEKAALESIVAAQAGVIAKNGRLLIACEAHNEMLLGRLKLAEGAQPSVPADWENRIFTEMERRFGLSGEENQYERLRTDDTQIGVEFALDQMRAMFAAPSPPTDGQAQQDSGLTAVYDAFGIGSAARELHVLMMNISNVKRRSECLSAIERTFFMVPGEPDEDFPNEEPADECLLNWGQSSDDYVVQFRAALDRIRPAQQDAKKVDAQPFGYTLGSVEKGQPHGITWFYSAECKSNAERQVKDSQGKSYLIPVYAAQPDPAMAGDEWLDGLRRAIEEHDVTGALIDDVLDYVKKRVQPASGEDKPC